MNKPPKVSVILPFYNAENTLKNAIQSIINQSFTDFELLLINNNSTDGSGQIAELAAKKDSRIQNYFEPRQGVVFAANLGFEKSHGKYIARMDADDLSYPHRVAKQVELLDSSPDIGLVSGLVKYQGDTSNGGFIRYVDWLNSVKTVEDIHLNRFAEYPIANPTVMIRRELFENFGGFTEGYFPEDYEFFLRLQQNGVKMLKVDDIILDWVDSSSRLTRTDRRYAQEAFFELKAKYIADWLHTNNPHHPDVWIWGGGKLARRRSDYLSKYGINVRSHIDVVKGIKNSVHYTEVEAYVNSFVLSYVTSWDARQEIRDYLNLIGFQEGINYLVCA